MVLLDGKIRTLIDHPPESLILEMISRAGEYLGQIYMIYFGSFDSISETNFIPHIDYALM